MKVRCPACWQQYDDLRETHKCEGPRSGANTAQHQSKSLLKPATCVNCVTLEREIASLREQLAAVQSELDDANGLIGQFSNTPDGAIIVAKDKHIGELEQQLEKAQGELAAKELALTASRTANGNLQAELRWQENKRREAEKEVERLRGARGYGRGI